MALTIEQLVEKRKRLCSTMADTARQELDTALRGDARHKLVQHVVGGVLDPFLDRPGPWFNDDQNFASTVEVVARAKPGAEQVLKATADATLTKLDLSKLGITDAGACVLEALLLERAGASCATEASADASAEAAADASAEAATAPNAPP
eukprot:168948-Prymnesium_polylepis.1